MNPQQQPRTLPSFSGLSSAVNEARDYEKSRISGVGQQQDINPSSGGIINNNNNAIRRRHVSPTSETAPPNAVDGGAGGGRPVMPASPSVPSKTDASGNMLVQDTLSPLLDEVDTLFELSKGIVADITAQGKQHDEDVR